jgi:tetratricopeptide (TPR) repeat protein
MLTSWIGEYRYGFGKECTMARIGCLAIVSMIVWTLAGCEEPIKDDARYHLDPALTAKATGEGFATPDAAEVDMVETLAASRTQYRVNLEALQKYYATKGNVIKRQWAEKEMRMLGEMPQYRYLSAPESVMTKLRATDSIQAADELYDSAMKAYNSRFLFLFVDGSKYRLALNRFNLLLSQYPTSDKADDATYRCGTIYEYFGDYEIAATCFQRAYQWSETTPYPARYRAALLLDDKLHLRAEAATLYQLALEKESLTKDETEQVQQRIYELTHTTGTAPAPAASPK